ncbi:PEGA domain-containing protein [bacterium]|nr:PEGA domain-containing protein [bacterium]
MGESLPNIQYYKNGVTKNIKYINRNNNKVEFKFNKSGKVISRKEFYKDKSTGEFLFGKGRIKNYYDVNKNLDITLFLNKDSNPVDAYAYIVFKKGKISRSVGMRNGLTHGKVKYFYNNGNLYQERRYINGKQNGKYQSYYKSGALFSKGKFLNDKAHGQVLDYYENGKIKTRGQHVNGIITKQSTYYEDSSLYWVMEKFKNQNLYKETIYYPNGNKKSLYNSKFNNKNEKIMHGFCLSYYDTGELYSKEYYKNGKKTTEVIYNKNGTEYVPKGITQIISEPSGAKIEIDGEYIGSTPLKINLLKYAKKYNSLSGYQMLIIKALPIYGGQQVQSKFIDDLDKRIPQRIYFDMSLVTTPKKYEIDVN